jgi:hypothetical protein
MIDRALLKASTAGPGPVAPRETVYKIISRFSRITH